MASEDELTSDSLDVSVRDVPDFLLEDLKSRVLMYISQTKDFSAQIQNIPGQSPKLVFSLGTKPAKTAKATSNVAAGAKTILVKNIPPSVDEDLLEVFFESKKKQGGGPVKCVKLFMEKKIASVEFEKPAGVQTVMKKRPIMFGQTTLDIQPYTPLLEGNEFIGSLDVKGLPKKLTEDILEMHLDCIVTPAMTFTPRQCHIRKWADFSGYGFTLHKERGRHGHYIDKINDGSPAQDAGLLDGDRIIEVNGVNINGETHTQIIQRIKAGGEKVTFLVVDEEVDTYYKDQGITVSSSMAEVKHLATMPR